METADKKLSRKAFPVGSALILAVVLTSLLAIIGVLFVMVSRVDRMATSSISENKELNLAVESVVAKISRELTLDVPGVRGQEYYDYPDVNDIWLASLEPYRDGTVYKWRQISDVYNKLGPNRQLQAEVPDYQDARIMSEGVVADADGDGVADSKWVIIPEMSSGKGKPIYAAIRIVDNGAMLNVNTAYKFEPDPSSIIFDIDGSSQTQINLLALSVRDPNGLIGKDPNTGQKKTLPLIDALLRERADSDDLDPFNLAEYEKNVIWNYGNPKGPYTPFDISDELELRYRFLVNHSDIDTRLETLGMEQGRDWEFRTRYDFQSPAQTGDLIEWFKSAYAYHDGSLDPNYAYRHIATTYNMDRIIAPNGQKMVNVNTADVNELYTTIKERLYDKDPNAVDIEKKAAQLSVNIVDLRDADAQVSDFLVGSTRYYGFEAQPYISELVFKISGTSADISASNHFAIELYNPLEPDIPLSGFRLEIRDSKSTVSRVVGTIDLDGYVLTGGSRFVITNGNAASRAFGVVGMSTGGGKEALALELATYESVENSNPPEYRLKEWYDVYLIRKIQITTPEGMKDIDLYLDKQETQKLWFDWDTVNDKEQFYARADNDWNVVYQNFVPTGKGNDTLDYPNGLNGTRRNYNFYNFANDLERFTSVGDMARALTIGPSADPDDMIGAQLEREPAEKLVRLDLQDPNYTNIFQYLTVIDPLEHVDPQDYANIQLLFDEMRIKGRININTAPWFVIAQLPWMQPEIAQAIVAYRDKLSLVTGVVDYSKGRGVGIVDLTQNSGFLPVQVREAPGFTSITELLNVTHALANERDPNNPPVPPVPYDQLYDIRKYGRDKELGNDKDQDALPDFTDRDGAENDFEERDLIFSRISNIITVRSDVFTAYILVRIGADGPQKRFLAILDRSQVTSPGDKVRILALHPVPDPR